MKSMYEIITVYNTLAEVRGGIGWMDTPSHFKTGVFHPVHLLPLHFIEDGLIAVQDTGLPQEITISRADGTDWLAAGGLKGLEEVWEVAKDADSFLKLKARLGLNPIAS